MRALEQQSSQASQVRSNNSTAPISRSGVRPSAAFAWPPPCLCRELRRTETGARLAAAIYSPRACCRQRRRGRQCPIDGWCKRRVGNARRRWEFDRDLWPKGESDAGVERNGWIWAGIAVVLCYFSFCAVEASQTQAEELASFEAPGRLPPSRPCQKRPSIPARAADGGRPTDHQQSQRPVTFLSCRRGAILLLAGRPPACWCWAFAWPCLRAAGDVGCDRFSWHRYHAASSAPPGRIRS